MRGILVLTLLAVFASLWLHQLRDYHKRIRLIRHKVLIESPMHPGITDAVPREARQYIDALSSDVTRDANGVTVVQTGRLKLRNALAWLTFDAAETLSFYQSAYLWRAICFAGPPASGNYRCL